MTPEQRRVLAALREGEELWRFPPVCPGEPPNYSTPTLAVQASDALALQKEGYVICTEGIPNYFHKYGITPAGRRALAEAEGELNAQ